MTSRGKIDLSHLKSLLFLCGLSGAGRSTALDGLADLGYFINENLPVGVCGPFLEHTQGTEGEEVSDKSKLNDQGKLSSQRYQRIALAPDVDSEEKVSLFLNLLKELGHPSANIHTIFLDARPDAIVRRYGQTRRPHPAFDVNLDFTLEDTIERERKRLNPICERANLLIDTSELNLHELRKTVSAFVASLGSKISNLVRINLIAFGFKHGIPNDCDLVTDVRFLPNPYFVPELKEKTGLDSEVKNFVLSLPDALEFTKTYLETLKFLIIKHTEAGKLYLNIGVGCTGGRHRSVVLAEELGAKLKELLPSEHYSISLKHRDILKG